MITSVKSTSLHLVQKSWHPLHWHADRVKQTRFTLSPVTSKSCFLSSAQEAAKSLTSKVLLDISQTTHEESFDGFLLRILKNFGP